MGFTVWGSKNNLRKDFLSSILWKLNVYEQLNVLPFKANVKTQQSQCVLSNLSSPNATWWVWIWLE